jgi:hypothetical protein
MERETLVIFIFHDLCTICVHAGLYLFVYAWLTGTGSLTNVLN